MKRMVMVLLGLVMIGWIGIPGHASAFAGVRGSLDVFYGSLAPHGEWIYVDRDVYAWRPLQVHAGWRPYLYGSWAWTDHGWYWVSEEPWAWAVYHYGRWYNDDYYGWIWMPGYEWAPAWVEWRMGGSYVGWAPLGPYAVFSVNFGVYYSHSWATPYHYWSFVPCHAVTKYSVDRYVYRTSENVRLIGRTRGAGSVRSEGGRIASRGPSRSYVEERGNIRIGHTRLVDVDEIKTRGAVRADERETVEVFRPRIEERSRDGVRIRPEEVRRAERTVRLDTRRIDARVREMSKGREKNRSGTSPQMDRVETWPSVSRGGDVRKGGSERRVETRLERGIRRPDFEAPVGRGEREVKRTPEPRSRSVRPPQESSGKSGARPERSGKKSGRDGGAPKRPPRLEGRVR
ncbi:MAG: DUF6600 domain-containing protein [Bacteroidota bacterium]